MPVLVGSALSLGVVDLNVALFSATLLGSVFIQIATNLTDEYSDHFRSSSTVKFLAPHKVIERGLLTPNAVLVGAIISYGLAILLGLYILSKTDWLILLICIPAVLVAFFYSAGPSPIGNKGISEVMVFILMGPMMVIGSYYVQTLELNGESFIVSVPVGLLVALIMFCNNLRDLEEDQLSGKKSLVSILGVRHSKSIYFIVLGSVYVCILFSATFAVSSYWVLLSFAPLPMVIKSFKVSFTNGERRALNGLMVHTATLHWYTGLGFAAGLAIGSLV